MNGFHPLTLTEIPEKYCHYRATNQPLDYEERLVTELTKEKIILVQETLLKEAFNRDKYLIVFTSITRDVDYQYKLAKKNKPRNIPTATPGSSGHQYGISVDIALRETFNNLIKENINWSVADLKRFLRGNGIKGISSEAWHHNILPDKYNSVGKYIQGEFGHNYEDITKENKEFLLDYLNIDEDLSFEERVKELQKEYSFSLSVDGIMGRVTTRLAWHIWAYENADIIT